MQAESGPLKGLNPTVTIISLILVVLFVLIGAMYPERMEEGLTALQSGIIETLGWYYAALVTFFLGFAIVLLFTRFGKIRLGPPESEPEFHTVSWFAMLFGCGMGIGLLFWSIAEPMFYFADNPFIEEGGTAEAARTAMRLTFFHWGLHPWAIYVVVALSLAFFSFRRGLPLAPRSALYPLIGDRIYGPIGHVVDVLAVASTAIGISVSLGLGAEQMATGLNVMTDGGVSEGLTTQLVLIAIVTGIATISVISGVGKGVKWLSNLNLGLSVLVMLFFLIFGPTVYLLGLYIQGIGDYVTHLVGLSTWNAVHDSEAQGFIGAWTIFYWAWWISWAPFVGMFIARISYGRTIREFIAGVLFVPTLFAFLWLVLFGGTALNMELFWDVSPGILAMVTEDFDYPRALFATIQAIDAGFLTQIVVVAATILIATYFVTSSDSGTLVITTILSAGDANPPTSWRAFWGVAEGGIAAVLLLVGGLAGLQAAAISSALPFSIVMILMCWGLIRALKEEVPDQQQPARARTA